MWLSWAGLARLHELVSELCTDPNTDARVAFSAETVETLGELLSRASEAHSSPDPEAHPPCPLQAEHLARSANELQARAESLKESLTHPVEAWPLSPQHVKTRQDFVSEWASVHRLMGLGGGSSTPLRGCSGLVALTLVWGW
ncbi:hypothetical protein MYSTI_02468 [Myxococcus stipitatus DSM 14675]|uniref:Uncharacterized protein n=1 Tax=Myxococcus stipitatus (strain DSM 14675 / JCM 12634 / Mx s8) TaxID=1278073 RepID=L7UBD6_MYXSD|nr:hypothetical protein [Myxococcus stipitatus]AGC43784.1 hypothetical protein MYSTI_02468 [Myxococcus stipitatus DSM 14675]